MKLSELRDIATTQKERLSTLSTGYPRQLLAELPDIQSHALIISGIRRCGKSTLLHQFVQQKGSAFFFLNFDDLRLASFTTADYRLLDTVIEENEKTLLFFDEIQSAPNWELYIRQKLDEQKQIVLTGSNASLLSKELGTKLSGRHITKELFPFSYAEYISFKGYTRGASSLQDYLNTGGFPEYLKTGNSEILSQLQRDILYRDIAVRYNIRDVQALKQLFTLIMSNAAHLVSPSKWLQAVGLKSPSTILEYFSYFQDAYLIQMLPRFSWSIKAQALSPKKLYIIDAGLIKTASVSFTPDNGSILENYVFMELRRLSNDIYYYNEQNRECDFLVNPHSKNTVCIQVCWTLTPENQEREIQGLLSALNTFKHDTGYILTFDTRDTIIQEGKTIHVLPAYSDIAQLVAIKPID